MPPHAVVNPNTAATVDPATDPTLARAEIDRLQRKNSELTQTIADLRNRLDETTRPGGALVHAYCSSQTQSRNTAGASADCTDAGYTCEPVSGMCRTSCQTSDQCSPGFLCDTGIERCVRP